MTRNYEENRNAKGNMRQNYEDERKRTGNMKRDYRQQEQKGKHETRLCGKHGRKGNVIRL